MEIKEFNSSMINRAIYSQTNKVLAVSFKHGNYRYNDVPLSIWEQMKKADSVGRFFNRHIRGNYSFTRIG